MKIDRVSYQKVYAVAAYVTERIGVEASVDEGQDPKLILAELKKLCDEVNQANNPHIEQSQPSEPEVLPVTPVEKVIGKSMVDQIMSSGDMKILETYRLLVKNNTEWKAAFDLRFDQLKQIEIKSIIDRANKLMPKRGV
jgi:hypothetical protein